MMNDIIGIIAKNKNIYNILNNYLINNKNYGNDAYGIYIKNTKYNINNNLIKFSIIDNENILESLRKFKLNNKSNIGIGQTNNFNNNKPINIYGPLSNDKLSNRFTIIFTGILSNKIEIINFLQKEEIIINVDIEIPFYLLSYLLKDNFDINNIRKSIYNLYKILNGSYSIIILIDRIESLFIISKNNNIYILSEEEYIICSNFIISYNKTDILTSDIVMEIDKEFNINVINNNKENIINKINTPDNCILNEYLSIYEELISRRYYNNKIIIPKLNNIKEIKNIGKIILITDRYINIAKYLVNLICLHFDIDINLFIIESIINNINIKKYINNNDNKTNIIILFGFKYDNISVEDNYSKIFINKINDIFKNSYNNYKILLINSLDILMKSKLNTKYFDCILETNINQEYYNINIIIFLPTLIFFILRKIKIINKDQYKLFINYIHNFIIEYKNIKEQIIKNNDYIELHNKLIKKYNDIYIISYSNDIENIFYYDLINNNYNVCLFNIFNDKINFRSDNYYIINFDKNYNKYDKNNNRKFDIFNFYENFKIKNDILTFSIFSIIIGLLQKN
jgi:hypothetical protein